MAEASELPQPVADEILRHYADVLRVGRIRVNGAEVRWDTAASNEDQLKGFVVVFVAALRRLPELANLSEAVFSQAVHLFCKVVSINYALSEILQLVERKVGSMCTIKTCGPKGASLVEYLVEVTSDRSMRVRVAWKGCGNIVSCDPKTAKKRVRGTLSHLETQFPLPPDAAFTPAYSVKMKLRRSHTSRLISSVAGCTSPQKPGQNKVERMLLGVPLRSSTGVESSATSSTMSTMSWETGDGTWSIVSSDDEGKRPVERIVSAPWSFTPAGGVAWAKTAGSAVATYLVSL